MADPQPMMRTVYYKTPKEGEPSAVTMYYVDAIAAVRDHPDQYSFTPWNGDAPKAGVAPPVDIPAHWRDLTTKERRAIAMALGEPPDVLPRDADEAIAEEEERRAKAQAKFAETESERLEAAAAARAANDEKGPVEIPDDFQKLPKQRRRMMAIRLGAPLSVKAEDADKFLAEELAKRKAAQPGD